MYSFSGEPWKGTEKVYEVRMNEVAAVSDVTGDHLLKLLDLFQNSV